MTQTTIPSPQTPWATTIQQRLNTAGLMLLGVVLAAVAVKTTGLSGKLGFAVVDLRLGDGNGLEVVKQIQSTNNDSRIIMLTGYGNIPTAVAAIKEGAIEFKAVSLIPFQVLINV